MQQTAFMGKLLQIWRQKRNAIILWGVMVVFLLCFAYCIPKTSDDWFYYRPAQSEHLLQFALDTTAETWATRDGRWLGNMLIAFTANSKLLRVLYWAGTMTAMLALLCRLSQRADERRSWRGCVALLLLLVAPKAWFSGNIAWLPAFDVYIMPVVLTLWYLVRMRGLFEGAAVRDTVAGCLLCFALGAAGQLFNEVMSACRIVMALGIVIWYWIRRSRPSWQSLAFLTGAAAGLAVMFASPAYAIIFGSGAGETYQQAATDIPGMIAMAVQNYRYVAAFAIGANTLPVCCISILCIAVLAKRDETNGRLRGHTIALIAVLAAAPLYFYFTTQDMDSLLPFASLFQSNMLAMLLDAAVYAAFVLAVLLVLLFYVKDAFFKGLGCFSLLSVLLCAAPLLVAQPLAHRIFAAGYIFLCLLALALLAYVLRLYGHAVRAVSVAALSLAAAACVIYMLMFAANPRTERQKIAFIESRMTYGETTIYTPDFLFGQRLWYPESELWAAYYYENEQDIVFEHIPYDMWYELFYSNSGLE